MNKFDAKFEKDFSILSCISTNMVPRNVWYVDREISSYDINLPIVLLPTQEGLRGNILSLVIVTHQRVGNP